MVGQVGRQTSSSRDVLWDGLFVLLELRFINQIKVQNGFGTFRHMVHIHSPGIFFTTPAIIFLYKIPLSISLLLL